MRDLLIGLVTLRFFLAPFPSAFSSPGVSLHPLVCDVSSGTIVHTTVTEVCETLFHSQGCRGAGHCILGRRGRWEQ